MGWSVLGMALPFFATDEDPVVRVNSAVVAAPTDQYQLSSRITLSPFIGLEANGGTVLLVDSKGVPIFGEAQRNQLATGAGTLLADGMSLAIGRSHETEPPDAPLAAALHQGKFEILRIKRGSLQIPIGGGRTETLTALDAEVVNRKRAGLLIRGSAKLRGQRHTFDAQVGASPERRVGSTGQSLRISLKGPLVTGTFEGRIGTETKTHVAGTLDLTLPKARDTAQALGLGVPASMSGTELRLKGSLDWKNDVVAFENVSASTASSDVQGVLSINLAGERPKVSATLASQALQFDLSRDDSPSTWLEDGLNWAQRARPDYVAPIATSIDADLRLSAQKLSIAGLALEKAAIVATAEDGRLSADFVDFNWLGALGKGRLGIDFNELRPSLVAKMKLDQADGARLSQLVLGTAMLQGPVSVTADLSGHGTRLGSLSRSLAGRTSITMKEGGRLGFDLRGLVGSAIRAPVYGWDTLPRGTTVIDSLEARLGFNAGTMTFEHFAARTGNAVVSLAGDVSLADRRIAVDLSLATLQPMRPAATTLDSDSGPFGQQIEIRGPLASPLIRRASPITRTSTVDRDGTASAASPAEGVRD